MEGREESEFDFGIVSSTHPFGEFLGNFSLFLHVVLNMHVLSNSIHIPLSIFLILNLELEFI